jgi:nucleotide-binding universal stress UspA family protein
MFPSFKNIFILVDFTVNTEVAINKALELISEEGSTIHLLHVNKPTLPFLRETHQPSVKKLNQWNETIKDYYPGVSVQIWNVKSISVHNAIRDKATEIGADLIVIGQTSTHN